ncbi:MAG: Nif11-like leader peptide family natural product precursor [Ruminiclostridium sp.]|nr:Nif11-like leader peptide family natural product precursor [Ruminiclostridium sp.]
MSDEIIRINVEDYIKDLDPEIQEKARACKDLGELAELAGEVGVELPDECVEMVAGGAKGEEDCPHPGRVDTRAGDGGVITYCTRCRKVLDYIPPIYP